MKRTFMLCVVLLGMTPACAERNIRHPVDSFTDAIPSYIDGGISAVDYSVGTWLCHRPGTDWHETECSEDCYEAGNESVFCWQLGGNPDAN